MIVCRLLGLYKFYLDPEDRDISPHILMDGYWEPRMTEAIVDRLQRGMTAVDAGANLGYFTILMGALVGPRGKVVAFEPNPITARRLEASVALNGFTDRVIIHRKPLGSRNGEEVRLLTERHHPGGTHITSVSHDVGEQIIATTVRLDSVAEVKNATLVKIDTEGSEERIWAGMSDLIQGTTLRYIFMEYTMGSYRQPEALLDDAVQAGFALMRMDERTGARPTTRAEILAGPALQMLLLQR